MKLALKLAPFFVIFAIFITQPINLITADLGRHLKNGELILHGNFDVLYKNTYSISYTNFQTFNHHFLSGVIFSLVKQLTGFVGLSFFYTALSLIALFIFVKLASKQTTIFPIIISLLITIPIITARTEVRPEVFTYIFAGIFFYLLTAYKYGKLKSSWLLILPIIEFLWVNSHIYFFLGPMILGLFYFVEFLNKKSDLKFLLLILLLTSAATFFNPDLLRGALYPVQILGAYRFPLAEEQPIWIIQTVPQAYYILTAITLTAISFIFNKKRSYFNVFLFALLSLMAIFMVRNTVLFGYFGFYFLATNLASVKISNISKFMLATAVLILVLASNISYWQTRTFFSPGLKKGQEKAAEFLLANNVRGPIFNNYDIGGYLIYYLYPKEKVFVDNRPEAYPANFWKNVYLPLYSNSLVWEQTQKDYKFNTIVYYLRDRNINKERFLLSIANDPSWALIYLDQDVAILAKKHGPNDQVIKKHELPKFN